MNDVTAWLLDGPPWAQYRMRTDLLGQSRESAGVLQSRRALREQPAVQMLLAELAAWPGPALKGHNDAAHLLHKLVFAADLGLGIGDPEVNRLVERIKEYQSEEGAFQVIVNIPVHHGGTGEDQRAWMLCDSPSILYALARFGAGADACAQKAARYLAGLVGDNGWRCVVAPELEAQPKSPF